jgi:chaperonin GroEL (HSP60 family)
LRLRKWILKIPEIIWFPSLPLPNRACGARIVSRPEELREEDVGTGAGLLEIKKIGDEYFTFITECKDPKACTILLRGASKDILSVSRP